MKKLLAGVIALCSIAFVSQAQDAGYKPGSEVADFKLKNVDGKTVSLSSVNDAKGYIVVFTCNHCPYAKAYEDRIIALHQKYAGQGYPVIAINSNDPKVAPDDSYSKMKERAKEKQFPFVYLYDDKQEIAKRFGAVRTPHVYLVQNSGNQKIVRYIGAIDNNWEDAAAADQHYVAQAIDELNAGKPVAMQETKAIGCTIKWKK
ncbi:MAG: thioredoxin family protein [Chitinophagaceae bacterium]|nr:thioredoxin family protein [Chitinophagaceae bacterium]